MISEADLKEIDSIIELGKLIKTTFSSNDIGPNDAIFVYKVDGKVVAFLEYSIMYETADILNIVVDPEYRRIGIASMLLDRLLKLDISHVMLEVRSTNYQAIEFYKKNGFEIIRTIKNYYGEEDGYSMERSLK